MDRKRNSRTPRLIALILFSLMLAHAALAGESNSYHEYQQKIQAINQRMYDWVATSDLWNNTNFITLYEKPKRYEERAFKFLGDTNNTDECKWVVVFSLQKSPLKSYVDYETKLLHLADSGKVSKKLLNRAVFPELAWSTKIQLHFEQPDVKRLLGEIARSDSITKENKEYVQRILSGKAREDIYDLREGRQLPNHE
jgi:hypothetical protein